LIDIRERQFRASSSESASDTQSNPARSASYECGLPIDTIHASNLPLATKRTRHIPPFGFASSPV
jgi:hypothetical protein